MQRQKGDSVLSTKILIYSLSRGQPCSHLKNSLEDTKDLEIAIGCVLQQCFYGMLFMCTG